MKLFCLRHTRVDVPSGICYGQTDVPLAASYAAEKKEVLQSIRNIQFDKVFSSPLSRCKVLAEELLPGQEIVLDNRLKELHFGEWEMKHWDRISQSEEAVQWFSDFVNVRCPGGESFRVQIERTKAFLRELSVHDYASVLLVTHGGIIRSVNCLVRGVEPVDAFRDQVNYGQLVSFELDGFV